MIDANTTKRQDWLQDMQHKRSDDNAGWWWAIACAGMATLVMLASYVGPAVFTSGLR